MSQPMPCSYSSRLWFQLLRAWRQYEDHKRLVETLAHASAQYDDPAPSEAMFGQLDRLKSRLRELQSNPVLTIGELRWCLMEKRF